MDENEHRDTLDTLDYDSLQEQRTDELTDLLDSRNMRTLKQRMEEMNEFDVAEFLSGIQDNRMPMVFRLLPTRNWRASSRNCSSTMPST